MTDRDHDLDAALDRSLETVRRTVPDEIVSARAVDRVWRRLADEAPLTGCADYRALLKDLIAGRLAPARALLVEDHTRECLACRRELIALRTGKVEQGLSRPQRRSVPGWLLRAAAAVAAVGLGWGAFDLTADRLAESRLTATVVDGSLQLVSDGEIRDLAIGGEVRAREVLRTPKDSTAYLRLADGSTLELAERSEVTLRAGRDERRIVLERGNIIVHAAPQHDGRLLVSTADCTVAVRGTIFAVDHGLKGSRVSVVEGRVEVAQSGRRDLLEPGEQVTTDDRLRPRPVAEEIAWSRDAESHLALLAELSSLRREVTAALETAPLRTSTRLLDLSPPDTVLYAGVPNLTDGLDAARDALRQRLATSPVLAAWWQEQVADQGLDLQIDEVLDRLRPLGRTLGAEIAIALPASALDGDGTPLILAELADAAAFQALLEAEIAGLDPAGADGAVAIVDESTGFAAPSAEVLIWIAEDLVAAAHEPAALAAVAARHAGDGAGDSGRSLLSTRLAEQYAQGAAWLVGLDLQSVLARAGDEGANDDMMLETLGITDATTLLLERHRIDDTATTTGELGFTGPRRGFAAWLAEPAPMGSLAFVSADATLVAAAVTRDAADMLDDLLGVIAAGDASALAELERLERESGFNLRADVALALGGEAAVALDGPVLPMPSWKLVVEVYDPATLQSTLERAVERASEALIADGHPGLSVTNETVSGRTFTTIEHLGTGIAAVFTMTDGYLVAAPSRALVERSLAVRDSGLGLAGAGRLRALLPDNGFTDCSALVFHDLGGLLTGLPASATTGLPPELAALVTSDAEPGVLCAYGLEDRIVFAGTGGGLTSLEPLLAMMGIADRERAIEPGSADVALSSAE